MGDHDTRFKVTLHYDGSAYHGWQVQPHDPTVQGELERALNQLTGKRIVVLGSGRTDAGVHATGQVASFEVPATWTAPKLERSLNALLPDTVWVAEVEPAASGFHPRYDAVRRTYEYFVGTAPVSRSPFHRNHCWPLGHSLDQASLQAAADSVVGGHHFEAFAKAGQPERGYGCVVFEAQWDVWAPLGVRFTITADRYLHRMVRYLVGTMVDVGLGKRPVGDMADLLDPDTSLLTSPPAPPQGLFLAHVSYESDGSRDSTRPRVGAET